MVQPRKSLGQHWLSDKESLKAICSVAGISSRDVILEVGPGLGSLTELLVRRAREVIAVEKDEELAKRLIARNIATNLHIFTADILDFNLSRLPSGYKIVANIPYYLTSRLIRIISESENPPICAVLLMQKEVAERVASKPGNMSILSVTAQYFWEVSLGDVIPRKLFIPPPKVDSRVLILRRREKPMFPDVAVEQYLQLVKIGFSSRRKTIQNSFVSKLKVNKDEASHILRNAGIDMTTRPQELSLQNWYDIFLVLIELDLIKNIKNQN